LPATAQNWVHAAPGRIARLEACLSGQAFTPHRHDTYAVAITLAGVQSFRYRGAMRHSLPGQVVVIHPDELHDGRAGNGDTFRYRSLYLQPAELQTILGGRPLPFLEGGVSGHAGLERAARALLDDLTRALDPPEFDDGLHDLALALREAAGAASKPARVDYAAVQRAREYVDAHLDDTIDLAELSRVCGRDRWQLSRDFRAVLGASPYRYGVFRRLDRARALMRAGQSLADVASACGFADQSHFQRHFKKSFGMTPKAWATHERSRA
jgi:AraC-like DNA-binding protein